jgi:hypothetical protein
MPVFETGAFNHSATLPPKVLTAIYNIKVHESKNDTHQELIFVLLDFFSGHSLVLYIHIDKF